MKLIIGIIDDDLVSQYATRYCIEQTVKDCKVLICDSAEDGITLFNDLHENEKPFPDILFLDLVMNGMNGWDFLKKVQPMMEANGKTEIYILSSFTNTKDRERAKKHPMIKGYFDKPLSKNMMNTILLSKTL